MLKWKGPVFLSHIVYCEVALWLGVEVTSRAVANLAEEDRLMPMLNNLSRQYLGPDYGLHRASVERVTVDQVDAVSQSCHWVSLR